MKKKAKTGDILKTGFLKRGIYFAGGGEWYEFMPEILLDGKVVNESEKETLMKSIEDSIFSTYGETGDKMLLVMTDDGETWYNQSEDFWLEDITLEDDDVEIEE